MSLFSRTTRFKPLSTLHGLQGLLIFLCLTLVNPVLHAEELDTKTMSATLAGFEKTLTRKWQDLDQLTDMAEQVTAIKGKAKLCITEFEPNKIKIKELLSSLGEPPKKESAEVKRKRKEVQKKLSEVDQKLANCRVLVLHSDELLKKNQRHHQGSVGFTTTGTWAKYSHFNTG